MADFAGQRGTTLRMLIERRQGRGAAGTELVPQLFGRGERIAQTAQRDLLRYVGFAFASSGRHQGRQAEHRLHLGHQHAGTGRRPGHGIKHIAHQTFGDVERPFEQVANLGINACQQLPGIGIRRLPVEQRLDESQRCPPECAGGRRLLGRLDIVQRRPHVFE